MKWYKHDANANADAKLKKLRIKYGMEGYGLYWYCLELICDGVDENKITFELEHDSEIIAHDTGIHYERVQEMMTYMVKLELFEMNQGVVTCLKMAKRIDKSMTSNPKMRVLIDKIRLNHDAVMTQSCISHDSVMQDKTRLDKNIYTSKASPSPIPHELIIETYHKCFPVGQKVLLERYRGSVREKQLVQRWRESPKHQSIEFWESYFTAASEIPFFTGKNDRGWVADFAFLTKRSGFDKVLEQVVDHE